MLMTPVMQSKQEKVDSKIFDILQECPETQCSSNFKHTEIRWLILFQFQSPPTVLVQKKQKLLLSTAMRTQLHLE